jgi:hypothetical protein
LDRSDTAGDIKNWVIMPDREISDDFAPESVVPRPLPNLLLWPSSLRHPTLRVRARDIHQAIGHVVRGVDNEDRCMRQLQFRNPVGPKATLHDDVMDRRPSVCPRRRPKHGITVPQFVEPLLRVVRSDARGFTQSAECISRRNGDGRLQEMVKVDQLDLTGGSPSPCQCRLAHSRGTADQGEHTIVRCHDA